MKAKVNLINELGLGRVGEEHVKFDSKPKWPEHIIKFEVIDS